MTDQRYTYKLPDGSTVEVDERTYIALHQLESTMLLLSSGKLSNFALIEVDTDGRDRALVLLGKCENLEILHRELLANGALVLELAKSWQGTAPPENQSSSRH